jgi:acetoin utilization protein AcuB
LEDRIRALAPRFPKGPAMNVRKHMSMPAITISEDTDFKTAMGLMQKHRIRRLPVVDAQGVLAGIVAERDLLVAADRYLSSPVDVARIMTRRVVTVVESTPVATAATLMIERKIGGLPVVDASRRLLGIITETDLLRAFAATFSEKEGGDRERRGSRAKNPLTKRVGRTAKRKTRTAKK